jgi:hypothetical protein
MPRIHPSSFARRVFRRAFRFATRFFTPPATFFSRFRPGFFFAFFLAVFFLATFFVPLADFFFAMSILLIEETDSALQRLLWEGL